MIFPFNLKWLEVPHNLSGLAPTTLYPHYPASHHTRKIQFASSRRAEENRNHDLTICVFLTLILITWRASCPAVWTLNDPRSFCLALSSSLSWVLSGFRGRFPYC
ncbi:hypothetical protein BDV26DRAFT_290870 [Aspergillus bertholletiae]|uniref:Uncharacterized protein n=1 Tax=Aspergillus bertholletiae TaxID=1226010 RepID=A0A5N7BDL3_9EURO|nr:hypothetical protein BDV26DRAFT_290870 [Aspergillus bertholletiae]